MYNVGSPAEGAKSRQMTITWRVAGSRKYEKCVPSKFVF